ncbi:MAG TPA: DUF72 domain-containing protein [Candidatus Baltobacteraceae bacterium]|nr:DUF72 domain-containing protein [Candidatus Baltobacteraceae bacterium]
MSIYVGTAGWAIPRQSRDAFPAGDSLLQRYAAVFQCTEINSSFYRPHRRTTYERWANSVPPAFRFSVKLPKAITHERKLSACGDLLETFLNDTSALGNTLGVYLVQLAPSHAYDDAAAGFFAQFRSVSGANIAFEPRHPSWWEQPAQELLRTHRITVAGADPARFEEAATSLPYGGFAYYRWHGSPRTYYSSYDEHRLAAFAHAALGHDGEVWCIFDNTALGGAADNALAFGELVR